MINRFRIRTLPAVGCSIDTCRVPFATTWQSRRGGLSRRHLSLLKGIQHRLAHSQYQSSSTVLAESSQKISDDVGETSLATRAVVQGQIRAIVAEHHSAVIVRWSSRSPAGGSVALDNRAVDDVATYEVCYDCLAHSLV